MPASVGTDLYLDLMAKVLTRYGFEGRNGTVKLPSESYPYYLWDLLRGELKGRNVRIVESGVFDPTAREYGRDWPADAETMIGLKRLRNIRDSVVSVIEDGVPGDLIETGAWRGGGSIYMRAVLKAYGVTDRTVWVADSFEGLPRPDDRFPADAGDQHFTRDELAISLEEVQENFERYDLLDDQVTFLKGWFEDTLPDAPIEQLSVLRLDGDMYSSTMDALNALYAKLSPGGFLIIDDYNLPGCRKAIEDFRAEHSITETVHDIDGMGSYWRRDG